MKKFIVMEVTTEGSNNQWVRPVDSVNPSEWVLASRIIECEWMERTDYPSGNIYIAFNGVHQAETEKDKMQAWIEEEPRANAGIFWTAGQAHFQLQDYEKARLAWFARMPGREG